MIPNHDADPCLVADWISGTDFPLDEDEKFLLQRVKETRYTQEPNHVERLYGLRILYWQVVGFLRGRP